MPRDIHQDPFDDETNLKLEIFKDYIKEWLPVFVHVSNSFINEINIYDLFAGPGKDINCVKGSPMLIIDEVRKYYKKIHQLGKNINIHFNEFDKSKYKLLDKNIPDKLSESIVITKYNKDFQELFNELSFNTTKSANLFILDQNGVKQITESVFSKLMNLRSTDILFFISSSYIWRFKDSLPFLKETDKKLKEFTDTDYFHVHRQALEFYKNLIPDDREYYTHAFSIKKGANIYGLIFGSNHILAMMKFLGVCWKLDTNNGEANFDINHDDIDLENPSMFPEDNIPSKIKVYANELEKLVVEKSITNNKELIKHSVRCGFEPKQTKAIMLCLKKKGILIKVPNISYPAYKGKTQQIELNLNV